MCPILWESIDEIHVWLFDPCLWSFLSIISCFPYEFLDYGLDFLHMKSK